jgi:hypothetical protein
MEKRAIGLRWTIGDVSPAGFQALRLSLWGAWQVFGPEAAYAVCVNTVPLAQAQARAGSVPPPVRWLDVTGLLPGFLKRYLDAGMAEGVGWKFAPLRLFPDWHELSLDNDCILWAMPAAIRAWLEDPKPSFAIAEDVRPCFGQFAPLCGPEPRNSGIRGLPPGYDLGRALEGLLEEQGVVMSSELDEQGLQVAVLSRSGRVRTVRVDEVTICSPFPPHLPHLGRCGAHFVGLNARRLPWSYLGRPASELVVEGWERLQPQLLARVRGS